MRRWILRWLGLSTLTLVAFGIVGACSSNVGVLFKTAPATPQRAHAVPDVLGPFGTDPAVTGVEDWTSRRVPVLRDAFETHVYGPMPAPVSYGVMERQVLRLDAFDGAGRVELWRLGPGDGGLGSDGTDSGGTDSGGTDSGGTDSGGPEFSVLVVLPNGVAGPYPTIVMQQFCGLRAALRGEGDLVPDGAVTGGCAFGPVMGAIGRGVFGAHIDAPPWEDVLARGYAGVVMYPNDIVPDDPGFAPMGLASMPARAGDSDGNSDGYGGLDVRTGAPSGAIAAWAWGFLRVVDVLDGDRRFDDAGTALWGHSRFGKAALVAAAYDGRVDMVIAHQSGTGGASLSRAAEGEGIGTITQGYPHWFAPSFATYAGREDALPVDQHQLLALIAPRPVLLGNARRDVWSGPEGAFRAAQGADPVYRLFGVEGLGQERLTDFDPQARLGFAMRPGRHGVTARDWAMFLDWLDRQI